jgi:hypothetical protein
MQISTNRPYDISTNYTIKLNEKESLLVEDDPRFTSQKKRQEQTEAKESQKNKKNANPDELSEDEKRLVKELATRDREVKAHEAAHQAAGGGMTGAASYTYQQGPDGKMYAIGGEVSISMPSGSTPEETIKNARQVAAAAMAAGDPSSQDFAVAASAKVMEMRAQQQLAKEQLDKTLGEDTYKNASLSNPNEKDAPHSLDIPA